MQAEIFFLFAKHLEPLLISFVLHWITNDHIAVRKESDDNLYLGWKGIFLKNTVKYFKYIFCPTTRMMHIFQRFSVVSLLAKVPEAENAYSFHLHTVVLNTIFKYLYLMCTTCYLLGFHCFFPQRRCLLHKVLYAYSGTSALAYREK